MGAGEERRKLLCQCGKPLGIFTAQGLELYCRFSKESTTVPYPISNLDELSDLWPADDDPDRLLRHLLNERAERHQLPSDRELL